MKKLIVCLLTILPLLTFAQDLMWKTLGKVQVDYIEDKKLGYTVMYPTFSPEILALEGKQILISGYIVPMDEGMGFFALSSLPYQACFFCGKAGPETVIEIHAKKPIRYTQRMVRIRGTLELNQNDLVTHLMYIINDAEMVE